MRYFDYSKLRELRFDSSVINLLTHIHEAKGRQELYLSQRPDDLKRLVEIAKVQSIDASNAIEGIRTTDTRLHQLAIEKTTPKNRDEEEISGYRDALNIIHESFDYIPLTPNYILQLHQILFRHVRNNTIGGRYKDVQNYIQGIDEAGNAFIIFTPPAPFETAPYIEQLCEAYNKAMNEGNIDPLILIPVFVHDFLCIHPFRDGNGRMSRLLTTLLLYRSGYFVGKYISLEVKIAKIKNAYYDALSESQAGWHEGKDDPVPFIKYMLSIVDMAYNDFEERLEIVQKKASAAELVETALAGKIGKIRKSDIVELCPNLSVSAIEKAIAGMVKDGKLEKLGTGRNTFYVKKLP